MSDNPHLAAVDKETLEVSPTFKVWTYYSHGRNEFSRVFVLCKISQQNNTSYNKAGRDNDIFKSFAFRQGFLRMDNTSLLLCERGSSPYSFLDLERRLRTNFLSLKLDWSSSKPVVVYENKFYFTNHQGLYNTTRGWAEWPLHWLHTHSIPLRRHSFRLSWTEGVFCCSFCREQILCVDTRRKGIHSQGINNSSASSFFRRGSVIKLHVELSSDQFVEAAILR